MRTASMAKSAVPVATSSNLEGDSLRSKRMHALRQSTSMPKEKKWFKKS